ncbi:ACT domain-containing protein [Atopomonas sediminilitoris]|uniref:ACT domain-containing protein n=1 Tax=Atopomonas sediminilitoris TaxID=2919919 RepID=UPI001F4E39AF|nr:ACT domain-containing protein [Atopomonas sediminilitoris]MCJ8168144.1 ACT domain-containing protein [Atopomonas sediminilitoris]
MSQPISDLAQLLRSLTPTLNPGVFVFSSLPHGQALDLTHVVAYIREGEGASVVLPEAEAVHLGLPVMLRAAWITLTVHSDLQAVGLTAAFATALGNAGVSCNVVAGSYHDHIFVPHEQAATAMAVLQALQQG